MTRPDLARSGVRRFPALLASVLVVASCGVLACRGAGSPAERLARAGGTAVLGSTVDVDSWNEYLARQSFSSNLHRRIWPRLARERGDVRDHPPTLEPDLAESWAFSEDGLALTVRLGERTWSDGVPITAEDVRFTWEAQTSPEVGWIGGPLKERIVSVKAPDPRTVVFRFDRAYPGRLADAMEGGILPRHVFGRVPFGDWRTHDWSAAAAVAAGPFLLEAHRPGEEIVLVRNPRYAREGLPRLDRVVVRIVPDASSLATQLLAGALDAVDGFPLREAERVRSRHGLTLVAYDHPLYDYIGWNNARPPFDDPQVRRALTLVVDRRALVEELLYGFGRVSAGPVLSFWWGADRTLEPWPHDPEEARRILAARGFLPRAEDGVLVRDGRPFAFEITTNLGNPTREAALVKLQEQFRRVGIVARVRAMEMAAFVHRNTSGDFDAYLAGWRFSGRIDLNSIFGSDAVPPLGSNVVRYRSAGVDHWLGVVAEAPDWSSMRKPLVEVQRIIHEEQPYTFLYETQRLLAAGPRLRGVSVEVPADPLAFLEEAWVEP
jgi:peptide/nickel transport system substrate-binding protein